MITPRRGEPICCATRLEDQEAVRELCGTGKPVPYILDAEQAHDLGTGKLDVIKNNQKLLLGVQGDGFLEKSPPGYGIKIQCQTCFLMPILLLLPGLN